MTDFIKTPLSESLDWDDVPPNTKGRVILKRWPADTHTAGGIITPGAESRRVMGVAWVYRASGDVKNILSPGDSVICAESAIGAGLQFPSDGAVDLSDYREIDAEDVYHVLPVARARQWRDKARLAFEDKWREEKPRIMLLADEGECAMALGMMTPLKAENELCQGGLESEMAEMENHIVNMADHHAKARQAAAEAADAKAKEDIAREREKLAKNRK